MRTTIAAVLLACFSSCLSPRSPLPMRWFHAEVEDWGPQADDILSEPVSISPPSAAEHLGVNVAWRRDGIEYGYYDQVRWTSSPSAYLSQALRTFPMPEGNAQVAQPRIDVHLEAFEEDLAESGQRSARVRLWVRVERPNGLSEEFAEQVQRPVNEAGPRALALEMRSALHDAVLAVMQRVAQEGSFNAN